MSPTVTRTSTFRLVTLVGDEEGLLYEEVEYRAALPPGPTLEDLLDARVALRRESSFPHYAMDDYPEVILAPESYRSLLEQQHLAGGAAQYTTNAHLLYGMKLSFGLPGSEAVFHRASKPARRVSGSCLTIHVRGA